MTYLEHTSTLNNSGTVHKHVKLQKYNDTIHKTTNKYYTNGKLVTKHARFVCESAIDNACRDSIIDTTKSWTEQ